MPWYATRLAGIRICNFSRSVAFHRSLLSLISFLCPAIPKFSHGLKPSASYRFVDADGRAHPPLCPINLTDLLYVRSPAVKPPIPVCSVVQSGASAFSLSCDDNLDFIRSALQLTPSPPPPSVSSSSARRKAVYGRWRVELTTSIAPISWSIEHECFLSARIPSGGKLLRLLNGLYLTS